MHPSKPLEAALACGDLQALRQALLAGVDADQVAAADLQRARQAGAAGAACVELLQIARRTRQLLAEMPQRDRAANTAPNTAPNTAATTAEERGALRASFSTAPALSPVVRALAELDVTAARAALNRATHSNDSVGLIVGTLALNDQPSIQAWHESGGLQHLMDRAAPNLRSYLKQFPYYPRKPHHDPDLNLNEAASFADAPDERITCRHLALHWIRQKAIPGARIDYRCFGNPAALEGRISADIEGEYTACLNRCEQVHLVAHQDFGQFLLRQFESMQAADGTAVARYLMLASATHIMAMELKCKYGAAANATVRSLILYDPNRTATHRRVRSTEAAAIEALTLPALVGGQEVFADYFGTQSAALILQLPTPLPPRLEAIRQGQSTQRIAQRRLSTPPLLIDATAMHHLMRLGFDGTLHDALQCIVAEPDSARQFDRLHSCVEGFPALFVALQNGHSESVRLFCAAVVASSTLQPAQKYRLLEASNGVGAPGISVAMHNGHADSVACFMQGVLGSVDLDAQDKYRLLDARVPSGAAGMFAAMLFGHHATVQRFCLGVLTTDALRAEDKCRLLQATSPLGASGLLVSLDSGHARSVGEFCNAVIASPALSQEQKFRLLHSGSANDMHGLYMAFENGHAEAVRTYVTAILNAPVFDEPAKFALLDTAIPAGFSGPDAARINGHERTLAAFVEAVAAAAPGLSTMLVRALLG